jgi:hypothetical protein
MFEYSLGLTHDLALLVFGNSLLFVPLMKHEKPEGTRFKVLIKDSHYLKHSHRPKNAIIIVVGVFVARCDDRRDETKIIDSISIFCRSIHRI